MRRSATRSEAIRPKIEKLVRELVVKLDPQTIILYGSYAYGEPDDHSDIDLFIVQDTQEPSLTRTRRVSEVARGMALHPSVQAIVYNPGQVERRLQVGDHFIQEILDRGVLLYGKSWQEERCSVVVDDEMAYAREWIQRAERDLQWVAIGFREDDPAAAGYYLQQALEKLLKAFLMAHGWRLQRTHRLEDLLDEAARHDPSVSVFRALCETVTKWYMADRYVDTDEEPPTEEQARQALETVQPLIERLCSGATGRSSG